VHIEKLYSIHYNVLKYLGVIFESQESIANRQIEKEWWSHEH